MRKMILLVTALFFVLLFSSYAQQPESLVLTTYYPSPYGSYRELTAHQMKIGRTYSGSGVTVNPDDLIVEGNVGIGTPTPQAKLDIYSTNSGFLPPRMTTAQRDAIITPPEGSTIYNDSANRLELYDGVKWISPGATCVPDETRAYNINACTTCWRYCNSGDVLIGAQAIDNTYGRIGAIKCAPLICQ